VFSTDSDNQTSVEVHVLQGERPMAKDNRGLGVFHLDGIPPAPRGVPQIEVTFDIDANGIMHVTAKDKATGKEQNIRITASSGLSEQEIKKMVDEAASNEADDKKKKEEVEEKNKAEALCYQLERQLKDNKDKIPADMASGIEAQIGKVRKAIESNDLAAIKSEQETLLQLSHKMAEAMYKTQGPTDAQGGPGGPGGAAPGGDKDKKDSGVVDAEFEEAQ
jgi:molecular chaperone DnaK